MRRKFTQLLEGLPSTTTLVGVEQVDHLPNQIDANVGGVNDMAFAHPNKQLCFVTCGNDELLIKDVAEYQMPLFREIEIRLKAKCDKLADAFIDDLDSSTGSQNSSARLPERVKLIIEEIEREEAALREDLYSADRKFAEYYNIVVSFCIFCKKNDLFETKGQLWWFEKLVTRNKLKYI